ncbi:MAG: hypothetical protein IJ539_05845 [Prevotella sp.]|nr:hypothetical protein [Prevotella sp.]MBR1651854.1 hypothetical protein [Alloprevotella sp.]
MASVKDQPATLCFSSMVEDIVFSTNAENGILLLEIVHNGERETILEETMYPSIDDTIVISDLPELVEPYARQYLRVTLECSLTDAAGKAGISPVTVLYSMADVGESATAFTDHHFMTILDGEKMTAMGRREQLSAYEVEAVTVIADVQLQTGEYNTLSAELHPFTTDTGISTFDVSPANVTALVGLVGGRLFGYTIEAGERRQRYRVVEDQTAPAPSLYFVNSFGCYELLHCVGTHKKDSKYERKSTRIKGRLKNYRTVEDRQFTANTGWLNQAMADWADDLFRSETVLLWVGGEDGGPGREVVISDSKSEITNEDGHMPAFEFTYTYAQRIHNVMEPTRAGRIFDNTFDHTFN